MKTLNAAQVDLAIEALRTSLQDTLDYAEPNDYEPGELEASFEARVKLLSYLGGTTAGLSGKNAHLLNDSDRSAAIHLPDFGACVERPAKDGAYECQNCGSRCLDQLRLEIPDYHERVADGEPETAGECPACGALCHEKAAKGE